MSSDTDRRGQLLVLSAPSGAGKTTLARRFLAEDASAVFSISVTTRAPRGAEKDGIDYHFVSAERFAELITQSEFAEWAEVHGARYGTLRSTVDSALANRSVAVFDIDVQGGSAIKKRWLGETCTVFILPPSMTELERRLRSRSTDSESTVRRRLEAARREIAQGLATYDFVLVNDSVEEALARLKAISAQGRATKERPLDVGLAQTALKCRRENVDLGAWESLR